MHLRGAVGDLHDSEDDVGLVLDRVEGNRGDHDDHEVEGPVGRGGQSVGGSADTEGHLKHTTSVTHTITKKRSSKEKKTYDLSGIQPGHAQPADGEKGVEDKQEDSGHDTGLLLALEAGGNRQDGHGDRHADGAEEHERAATDFLDDEDGDPRRDEVLGAVAGSHDTRHQAGHAETVLVDGGGIVRDQVDAGDLLEHLVDVGQDDAVEVALLVHLEQVAEAAPLHLNHGVLDRGKFSLEERVTLGDINQRGERDHGLVFLALENEPTWGLRQEHDKDQDDQRKDDLEGDREPPGDSAGV